MFRIGMAISALFLCFPGAQLFSQKTTPVIRQVDHILVESRDPKALFSFFADTLQLPVAWPLVENDTYITGGIGAGNLNLELFLYPGRRMLATNFYGIAFEPYPLADALRRLQSLNIPHNPPDITNSVLPNGTRGVAWTTVAMPTLSKSGMSLFLYEYSPAFLKVEIRRKQLGNRLRLNNGGPLGFQSVSEIVIGTTHLKEDREVWSRLLGKPPQAPSWSAGGGVAMRLAEAKEDRIHEITFKVDSLKRAEAFLKENKLQGPASPGRLSLSPSKLQGLRIFLTDKP
jgi:hypothetical protein